MHISTCDESRLFCTSFFQIEITQRTFAFSVLRSDSFLAFIMIRAGSKYVKSERKKSAQLNEYVFFVSNRMFFFGYVPPITLLLCARHA